MEPEIDEDVEFQRANVNLFNQRKTQELLRRKREKLDRLWSQIDHIDVRCPACGETQASKTIKSAHCRSCGNTFQVIPENAPTRIADTSRNQKIRTEILIAQEMAKKPKL